MTSEPPPGDEGWQRPAYQPAGPYQAPPLNAQPTMPLPPPPAAAPPGPLTDGFNGPAFRAAQPTNRLAITALVLSLAGLVVGVTAPIGAVLGHRAHRRIEQTRENGDAAAMAAIILGWIITGVCLLLCCAGLALLGVKAGTSRIS